jgi:hypothetical protein
MRAPVGCFVPLNQLVRVSVSAEAKMAHANAVHFHIYNTIVHKLQPIAMILLAHFPLPPRCRNTRFFRLQQAMIQARASMAMKNPSVPLERGVRRRPNPKGEANWQSSGTRAISAISWPGTLT